MGNYHCKTLEQPNYKSSHLIAERVSYQPMDDNFEKANFWKRNSRGANICKSHMTHLGEEMEKVPPTIKMSISEFLRICSQNRPSGVSDDNWQQFLNSTCSEYFNVGSNGDLGSKIQAKSVNITVPVTNSPSRSSIDAVMDLSMQEASLRLSHSSSVSIVEFAGRFALPHNAEYNQSDAESTSIWVHDTECSSFCDPKSTSLKCQNEFVSTCDVGAESYKVWKSKCTALCLGDVPSGSYEESSFYDENKISTTFANSKPEPGVNIAQRDDLNCEALFDEIKVNIQISRAL